MIRTVEVMDGNFCETVCYMKNVVGDNGRYKCELNNSTFEGQQNKLEENSKYLYRGAKVSFASTSVSEQQLRKVNPRVKLTFD